MAQVSIKLKDRTYSIGCADGEEDRLRALADYVVEKIDDIADEFGQIGPERALLMSALLITDELFEARDAAKPSKKSGKTAA